MSTTEQRYNMVVSQIKPHGITDENLLDLFANSPKEMFVPKEYSEVAYADYCIPLNRQSFSLTPRTIGKLLNALQIKPKYKVLEIGTGSGYLTYLLSKLANNVTSLDIDDNLINRVQQTLRRLDVTNVNLLTADGYLGYTKEAPYDSIIATCSYKKVPTSLLQQLSPGGKLFVILGEGNSMQACIVAQKHGKWVKQSIFDTVVEEIISEQKVTEFIF